MELDAACCRFAGIAPNGSRSIDPEVSSVSRAIIHKVLATDLAQLTGLPREYCVDTYPPVSSDWGAAGRLMDAISAKGHRPEVIGIDVEYQVWIPKDPMEDLHVGYSGTHKTFPMALALAVKALAEGK
jgi:hypothetical protein